MKLFQSFIWTFCTCYFHTVTSPSRIRSTKQGFVKKNVRGLRYKPRGDWFSFGKVRKRCFLCSYKHKQRKLHTTVYIVLNMDLFIFYKNASIRYRRPLFTPRSRVKQVLICMHVLYLTTFALLNTTTRPCHYRAWKSQDNFEYYSDWIHLKEESHIHLGGWVNHGLIFIFRWTVWTNFFDESDLLTNHFWIETI